MTCSLAEEPELEPTPQDLPLDHGASHIDWGCSAFCKGGCASKNFLSHVLGITSHVGTM